MIDRYQIIRLITKDKLGGIYLAKDTETNREVSFRNFDTGSTEIPFSGRIESYAHFASRLKELQHPHLIFIHDVFIDEEEPVLISQFIEAKTIAERLQDASLAPKEMVEMAMHLLTALQTAHAAGIYHGALHTGSIKCLPNKQGGHDYVIIDLGLKQLSSIVTGEETHPEDPILIAPELSNQTEAATAQSDLFTIGQLCYTALAGGHPFTEYSAEKCAKLYKANKLPPLSQFAANIPPALIQWILTLTEGKAQRRPASAKEALEALKTISLNPTGKKSAPSTEKPLKPTQTSAKKPWMLVMAAVSILVIGTGVFFANSQKEKKNNTTDQTKPEVTKALPDKKQAPKKAYTSPYPELLEIIHSKKIKDTQAMQTATTVPLKASVYYDWAILLEGKPNSRNNKTNSPYDLIVEGPSRGTPHSHGLIHFDITNKSKTSTVTPIAARTHSTTNRSPQTWEINFRPPKLQSNPLEVVFYITQDACDLLFNIDLPDKEPFQIDSRSQGPGVVEIKLLFPKIRPRKLYSIEITAKPNTPDKPYTTGLHGVFLSTPQDQELAKLEAAASAARAREAKAKAARERAQIANAKAAKRKAAKAKATQKKQPQPKPPIGFQPILSPYTSDNHFNSPDWYHAEGSIIKIDEGKYCLYYSRWRKNKSVNARITHPEIALATSSSSSGPWKHQKRILRGRENSWDKFGVSHPIIQKFEGKFYLYYVSTNANINKRQLEAAAIQGGDNKNWSTLNSNRCIGVARAPKHNGPWERMETPIIKAQPPFSEFSCSPSVAIAPDGDYLMMVCSKKGDKTVSYITKSTKPHFSNPTTIATIPGENFSLWHNTTHSLYQFIQSGDEKHFRFYSASKDFKQDPVILIDKKQLISEKLSSTQFHSPNVFLGSDGQPEVFIFHSDDPKNGGIFTIPFKK